MSNDEVHETDEEVLAVQPFEGKPDFNQPQALDAGDMDNVTAGDQDDQEDSNDA